MNYIETGLPHTDLFRRKSQFEPPRYKPLCNLGRKYLGLEPVSKSELDSITSRLCRPKKILKPDDPLAYKKGYHPIGYGSGRFSGRRRMTGDQIENMVARLTKKKSETSDKSKVKNKSVHFSTDETTDVVEDETGPSDASIAEKDKHQANDEESTKVQERTHSARDNFLNLDHDKSGYDYIHSSATQRSNEKQKSKVRKDDDEEEEKYESLYYRGVRTEISRKFLNKNYKRLSVHSLYSKEKTDEQVDMVKAPKTEIFSMNTKSDDVVFSFRPMRVKSTP